MPKLESRLADIELGKSACAHHSQRAPKTLQLGKTSLNTTREESAHHN